LQANVELDDNKFSLSKASLAPLISVYLYK